MDYLEDQSRRNNLRFEGIVEETGENWEQTAKKVEVIVREKLGITDTIQIERAHRVGKHNSERPRLVVAKFLRFNDRENILRSSGKLKGTNIYINEDLCETSQAKRRSQLPQLKQARSQGKIAYFVHTRLVIKDRVAPHQINNERTRVTSNSSASNQQRSEASNVETHRRNLRSTGPLSN